MVFAVSISYGCYLCSGKCNPTWEHLFIAGTIFGMLLAAGAQWLHLGLLGVAGARCRCSGYNY